MFIHIFVLTNLYQKIYIVDITAVKKSDNKSYQTFAQSSIILINDF